MSTTVLRSVMDEAEYERERQRLTDLYGSVDAKSVEVIAKRDQAYAALYHSSGWTQERLAEKEGKSRIWIQYRLRFGRFITFSANVTPVTIAQNLTEGRFRSYWERTDKTEPNDNVRFREVVKLMEQDVRLHKPHASKTIGRSIMEQFADGEWHRLDTIIERIEGDEDDVTSVLKNMQDHGANKSIVETKPYGASKMYRIMRQEKMISSHELATKLSPLIKALLEEGRKTTARMSPPTVARLASQIQRLLDEWSE
jgi:hypothetical protein